MQERGLPTPINLLTLQEKFLAWFQNITEQTHIYVFWVKIKYTSHIIFYDSLFYPTLFYKSYQVRQLPPYLGITGAQNKQSTWQ